VVSDWSDWIGRTVSQSDMLTPALIQRHRATLDRTPADPAPLPGIHWVLNLPEAATAELGEDGHPRRAGLPAGKVENDRAGLPAGKAEKNPDIAGSFLPPIDLPRRMWASSEVEFVAPIAVGATVERVSTIADIAEKSGNSGRLAFVTLDHRIAADGVEAIREKQTLVYREALQPSTPTSSSFPRRRESLIRRSMPQEQVMDSRLRGNDRSLGTYPHHHTLTPTETLLFRFSALTFNTHRIHYDAPYARDVEGYAGLVVQGPLTATLLLNWATTLFGPVRAFRFRALAPAFAGAPLTLVARQDGDAITLAALGPDGSERVKASATL
jgi:3-methylfumaryl-CoA hydratase